MFDPIVYEKLLFFYKLKKCIASYVADWHLAHLQQVTYKSGHAMQIAKEDWLSFGLYA